MYQKTPIKWLIDLNKSGGFVGLVPTTSGKPGKADRANEYLAPHIGRSSGVRAKLLADTGEYVLGVPKKHEKPTKQKRHEQRVRECHREFVDTVKQCATATGEPAVKAVLSFFESRKLESLSLPSDFDPADNLTFRVGGVFPIDLGSVRQHWASIAANREE